MGRLESGVLEKDGKQFPCAGFKPQFEERTDLVTGVWKGKKVSFKGRGWAPTNTGLARTTSVGSSGSPRITA